MLQKSPQARGATQCISGRAITWLDGVTIYYAILQSQVTCTSPVFTLNNTFEKKKVEMLIEKIIEFELRVRGPPGRTYLPKLVNFMSK